MKLKKNNIETKKISKLPVVFLAFFIVFICNAYSQKNTPEQTQTEQTGQTRQTEQTGQTRQTEQAEKIKFPKIDRYPTENTSIKYWTEKQLALEFPSYNSQYPFSVDLRNGDISKINLSDKLQDLLHADFDSKTKWPKKLPKKFNPNKIMEIGKNPGLNVRKLHKQGITGKGVGIAIIDRDPLLVGHGEYKDRVKLYEEINIRKDKCSDALNHGPAVISIAAGKKTGVAPKADLYFIAATYSKCLDKWVNCRCAKDIPSKRAYIWGDTACDASIIAKAIDRIVEINRQLPKNKKIRVISISKGINPNDKGTADFLNSVQKAQEANIFVIIVSMGLYSDFEIAPLGRDLLSNPNKVPSYKIGKYLEQFYFSLQVRRDSINAILKFPMDARTTASPTGVNDYVFYSEGGMSWVVPWVAGLYALACQVYPEVTPELFFELAFKTASTNTIKHKGKKYKLENIVNPVKLIKELKKLSRKK